MLPLVCAVVSDHLLSAIPGYAGITLDNLGQKTGVEWHSVEHRREENTRGNHDVHILCGSLDNINHAARILEKVCVK